MLFRNVNEELYSSCYCILILADPKARLKEEDEDLGIVLSPQRRSFGTGCHVTTSNKLRPGSPTDADP